MSQGLRSEDVVKDRVVYSSEKGRICGKCGWPASDCHCSGALPGPQEAVPAKITVINGLPKNTAFLEPLAKELKKSCGTGGKAGEDFVELQGDQRERLRDLLSRKGWAVKG